MANRFSDYLTPDEFAQLMKTNPTAVTGNRELEAIAQFKADGGKLRGDLPQPSAESFDEWDGGFDHAEAAQKLMDDVENAEINLDYDATKEPWVGKAFNNTIEKIKDTQLYAQYMYSPEDWADKGKEIFDVTGIDVNNLNDKELFNKAWNVTKEYKKKAAIYADENGHVNMDKVYEAMPYLRDIHEAHGTSAAVQVMRSAKQLQTINDLYDSEGARFLASLGYGAKGAAMQAGLQVYGAKAMLNGLLFGEQLTDKQANDIMWFQKQLESMPEFSYTSVGGAVGGALGSAIENAPIMAPEMARTAAVTLGAIPVPMAKALGVALYAAMSTQIAGQQYIDNLLKTDENGNPIYTPRQAALLSLAQGFVEGALEKRSIATAGKAVFSTATATKLSEIYAKDVALAEGQTLSGATREAISNVVKERVRHGIKAGGVSFGAELEEEFEQKVSDMVLENMAQIAIRGNKADVASIGKILEDSFAEAAEAIPAVAGFSLIGAGGAVVKDAKTIHDTRKRFINSRANSIMNNYYINDEMKNILHGVADNLDNIEDLESKAPEVVEKILNTQNEKVGLKEVEVDIGELKQIGHTDVIDTIAKKANVSQEELMACLNGTGRLTVAFSKLQLAERELSDEGKAALDNNVSTVGGVTDRENKENVELLKMIADTMKKRTDEETSDVVSQFVHGTFADEETRNLAKEIIEADLSNPYEEVKRRQRDVASLIDEYLGDTIAQMKAEGGQGVDIVVGEEGRGTRVSNNPQWYRNWYADFGRAPTDEDYERLAYEFETGQATRYAIGSYGEVTPEEAEVFKEKQKLFDELFAERERLKNIQQSLEGIKKDDFLAYASLPVEARQVYHVFADALSKSDSADVRKSATANAIVASMIAHRVAEARRAHGENVSDLDVIPNIGNKEQGELSQMKAESEAVRKQYEGTDKWLKAPNGEPTNLTEKQWLQVRTHAFKAWFGDWENDPANASKVVDENGEPLVMYHGTSAVFDTFDTSEDGESRKPYEGTWSADYPEGTMFFTSDLQTASSYGYIVMPVFLNLRYAEVVNVADGESMVKPFDDGGLAYQGDAIVKNPKGDMIACTMEANQIKSAVDNNGNFSTADDNIYHQFAGQKSLTANTQKLAEAMSMEQAGATANEIYKKTGWLKGKDNGWRYEIKDKLNSIDLSKTLKRNGAKLSNVYDNKELFDAYPQLKDIQVSAIKMPKQSYGETLIYDDGRLRIHINKNHIDEELDLKTTLVHEIAHCIQAIEGFANGASPSDVMDYLKQNKVEVPQGSDFSLYKRIAGEQEAREVEKRARATMLLENKDKAIAEGDTSKKAKFARKVLAQAANRMPVPHKADAIVILGDVGVEVSANVETPTMDIEEIPAQEGSGSTQVAGTTSMYVKALAFLRKNKSDVRNVLDYGAGLGLGTDAMREANPDIAIDSYEPNPERWRGNGPPNYTDNKSIDSTYDAILNTNVLNVVEPSIRDMIVRDIGRLLNPNGEALITTRSWKGDIDSNKNYDMGDEYHSMWVKKTINGKETRVYQKGFDGNELVEYVKGILGDGFDVKKVSGFGKSSVLVTKKETPVVSAEKAVDEFLQSAWHGTPYKFDSFDLGKIGTGEGAQAHGWGLYFAQDREVAEGYKKALSSQGTIYIDGRIYYSDENDIWYDNETNEIVNNEMYTALYRLSHATSKEQALKDIDGILSNKNIAEHIKEGTKKAKGILEGAKNIRLSLKKGSLIEVEIPKDNVLLDTSKTIEKQPALVKKGLYETFKEIYPTQANEETFDTIKTLYRNIVDESDFDGNHEVYNLVKTAKSAQEKLESLRNEYEDYKEGQISKTDIIKKHEIIDVETIPYDEAPQGMDFDEMERWLDTHEIPYSLENVPQEKIDAVDIDAYFDERIKSWQEEYDGAVTDLNTYLSKGVDYWLGQSKDQLYGYKLQYILNTILGGSKETSLALNAHGIKGNIYNDEIDGRCFVVFDDKAINIINTYNQKINGETKGSYSPTKHMLTLFKTADQSTFMHEMSHFYLSELMQIAKIDENSAEAKMLKTITDWAEWHKGDAEAFKGTASYNEFSAYEKAILEAEKKGKAKLNDKEYTKEQLLSIWVQEKFSRGFETYLQSGEAPTTGLKRIFARFKQWLKKIYLAYTGAGVEPSSDVKAIMARMVATDEAIAMASIERKVSVLRNKLGDDVFEKDTEELREKWLQEAEEEAKAKLLARLIKQQKEKNIDEHMKAYEETIREQLTEENAFVVQALIEEGFTEEEAIKGIYPSVDVWKKDLEAKGGSYEKAIEKAVTEERERYKQEMPSEEELRSMAEEELISHTTELETMEAEILARREKKYKELPTKVTSAIAEMDEAIEFEESDNPLKLAMTKLKYAYRWNEQQKAQIENMQKQIDALKEKSAEEKKHLKAELKANLQAFKENTLLNKNWLKGVRDATKGKVKEIRAYATNNLMTMPIREAMDTKRFIGEARKEAKTVLAKLTKAISGNKQAKISLSTETALSNTMQEAEAEKDNSAIREAYYAKIREAVYVEQARQSVRIKQGVEKMKARLTRIGKSVSKDKKAEFDASAHYYIGHILYMTGITKKDARRPQTLVDFDEFIKGLMNDFEGASENETVDYKVPSWLKELATSKGDADDYRAYRFGEMQDLTTLIVNIYTTARNKDRLFTSDKKASEVQKEMLDDYKHTVTAKDGWLFKHDINEYFMQLIHPVRLLETLGGSYKKYIYDILAEANEKKKAMQQVAADRLNALFEKYWDANTRRKLRSKKDYVAPNGQKLSKENILVMALNWGNTGNRTRVINTFSTNIEDEGEALHVKSEIEKLFEDVLTAKDWQFVQEVWQFIGAYGDMVSTVVETETGTPMKRVEAEPFEIATSDGLLINVDGGYYPIAYDTENATGYIDEEGVPTLSTAAGANGVFNANMGSTKDRSKKGVVGGKIRLDIDKLFAHVNQQIHIATMRLAWRDAYKLIKSRPIRETIVQTYGAKAYYSLKEWVEDCWSTPIRKRTWVEELTDKLRQRTVTAIMAYRVSTAVLNFANPVYMAREIGVKNTVQALIDYYGNLKEIPKKMAWVKRQSSFMRNRAHNLDRDFNRTKTDSFDRGNPVRRLISQYGNYVIEETDLWFSIPTYYWTYKQVYNEELGNGTSNDNAKKIAHRKAEDTVRRIFGSSETVDQSEVQRSKSIFMKAMTPFYTFASTQANHLFGEYLKSKYQGYNIKELEDGTIEREKKKFYKTYWGMFLSFVYTYVLGAFVEQAIREGISQLAGDDKDKKEKLQRMKQGFTTRAIAQGIQSLGSGFPVGNIIASLAANEILGETYGASNFGIIDAAYSRFGTAAKKSIAFAKGKTDAIEAGRAVFKAVLGAGKGIPDTFVDAAFNGARAYVDHYSVEDWFRKSLFDKKLKKKGK